MQRGSSGRGGGNQQRGGSRGGGAQQQHGRGGAHRGGRGGAGGGNKDPNAKTKKQIEEEQQQLAKVCLESFHARACRCLCSSSIQKQVREKREEQLRVEHEKKLKELGIESSHSLVPNALGELEQVPDISARWIEIERQQDPSSPVIWFPFLPQDAMDSTSPSSDQDAQTTELVLRTLNASLLRLLKMPYKIFWSHVLFDDGFKRFFDSFLRFYPRFYDSLLRNSEDGSPSSNSK